MNVVKLHNVLNTQLTPNEGSFPTCYVLKGRSSTKIVLPSS